MTPRFQKNHSNVCYANDLADETTENVVAASLKAIRKYCRVIATFEVGTDI